MRIDFQSCLPEPLTLSLNQGFPMNQPAQGVPRLGIAGSNFWSEALHGVSRNGRATVFPQAIGMAATWDKDLIHQIATAISDEGRAKYHEALRRNGYTDQYQGLTFWSPNVNIFRDPRWGRGQEIWGEDPFFAGEMASEFVKGLQGDHPRYLKAAACAKHYAVHSGPEKDRHTFNAIVSKHDLYDTYLPAFKKLVMEAKVESVMGAYNRTLGEPCNGSKRLLENVLRGEWGFQGHVVSDCGALSDFHLHHKVTKDAAETVTLALKRGCDLGCDHVYSEIPEAIFWRPSLQNCPSKHYHPAAQRALPAVIFGVVGEVGEINGQRIALPKAFERVQPKDPSEKQLWRIILKNVHKTLAPDEIVVVDAGVKVRDLQKAEIKQYVVRLATNFTACRNVLPDYCGLGRKPIYGELIRPLPRKHKENTLPASAPDERQSWEENGQTIRTEIWRNLVLPDCAPNAHNPTFDVYAIYDPRFDTPWLLATPVVLKPVSVRVIYKDRWLVEQIPLSAKQMLGSHRQFVHAEETIQRLPELALMAGSILSFLSATCLLHLQASGIKNQKERLGGFGVHWLGRHFPKLPILRGDFEKRILSLLIYL
jgi:beta-glucosidase-like glycosyl hydrolase